MLRVSENVLRNKNSSHSSYVIWGTLWRYSRAESWQLLFDSSNLATINVPRSLSITKPLGYNYWR